MRTITTSQQKRWEALRQRFLPKVEIEDDSGTLQDWTDLYGYDWINNISIDGSIDVLGRTASITLAWRQGARNASPFVTGTQISGWLDIGREVVISVAVVPVDYGTPSGSDYIEIFRGKIDSYDLRSEPGTIEMRDSILAQVADRFVETEAQFGDSATQDIEDVLSALLAAYTDGTIVEDFDASGFAVFKFNQQPMHVIQALQDVAFLNAWDLRSKYDEGGSQWALSYYEPDRASSGASSFTFTTEKQLSVDALAVDIADVRNVVRVTYIDRSAPQDDGDVPYGEAVATDSASVAKYGRRWMQIVEGTSSLIDTSTEATNLASAILDDLKEPLLDYSVTVPLFPWVEVNDIVTFEPDGRRLGADQDLAVMGWSHNISPDGCTTTLVCSGAPKSGRRNWLDREAQPGQVRALGSLVPPTPGAPTIDRAALINKINVPWPDSGRWDLIEVFRGTSSGFTPSSSNLIGFTRGGQFNDLDVVAGTTYYYKVKVKDKLTNVSLPSAASAAAAALPVDLADLDPNITAGVRVSLKGDQTESASSPFTVEWDVVDWGDSSLYDGTNFIVEVGDTVVAQIECLLADGGNDISAWSARIEDANTGDIIIDTLDFGAGQDISMSTTVRLDSSMALRVRVYWNGTEVVLDASRSFFSVAPLAISP